MRKATFHQVVYTRDEKDKQVIDDLLWQRYCYTVNYLPNVGYQKVSANFKDSVLSKVREEVDISDIDPFDPRLMESVEFCLFQLDPQFISAIEREMKNRAVKAQVWRYAIKATYPEALDAALIAFRKGGLV